MAKYTLSVVCNDSEKAERMRLCDALRESLRKINYKTIPGQEKAREINAKLSELAEPLWSVSIDYVDNGQTMSWQCWASMAAINEWRRMPSMRVNVGEQWAGPRMNRSGGRRSNNVETLSLDSDADKFLEAEAQRAYRNNGNGLGRWQNAFRLARLDSSLVAPQGNTRADQKARNEFYLREHPYAAESIAYKTLHDGSVQWLANEPQWVRDLVSRYLDLWDGPSPYKGRQKARFHHDRRDKRQISRIG